MNAFTIKDLENLSGIKAHTIRIWEQRYSFIKPQRTGTNIRYYSNDELRTILNIALLNKYGYKISHIDKMQPEQIKDKVETLQLTEAKQERVYNELINHMVNMNMDDFEEVLDGFIFEKGIDKTITQIIFPFLEKVGILWQTNHIYPAQEHLVTNIIRQKLVVGIEGASSTRKLDKNIILFLPENEFHELGLLFINYLLKIHGVKPLYLGASVPLKDLKFIVDLKPPEYIHTHLSAVAHNFNFEKYLNNLHNRLPNVPIIISGWVTQGYKKTIPPNITFKHSLSEVIELIATLN